MSKSLQRALVFSGQGAHRRGMATEYLRIPAVACLWERMKGSMEQKYGISLQDIITENPTRLYVYNDAYDVAAICERSCQDGGSVVESTPKQKLISHPQGVLSLTSLTQPCMLAAHMVSLEYLKETRGYSVESSEVIAGHSLGEFSALCALGVLSPEVAVDLVYRRGALMEDAVKHSSQSNEGHLMFACNPQRAKLCVEDPDLAVDQLHIFVELIARNLSTTASFIEVVNYNISYEQYVVVGDPIALSALGKCLDPQFRATSCGSSATLDNVVRTAVSSVLQDKQEGITMNPNTGPAPDFVTSCARKYGIRSTFRRFLRGPDDGYTPSLEELTHLTLQEDGRSGLKKKSWFIPLPLSIPFHSSRLRRAMDLFLPVVRDALPDEETMRSFFCIPQCGGSDEGPSSRCASEPKKPVWLTNLTGTAFRPFDVDFQRDALDAMQSMNVGEIRHNGRYHTNLVELAFKNGMDTSSVRDMCAAVLAAQLAHPVQWIDVMDSAVFQHGVREAHEISPVRTVADMFKRTVFRGKTSDASVGEAALDIVTRCLPSEERFL